MRIGSLPFFLGQSDQLQTPPFEELKDRLVQGVKSFERHLVVRQQVVSLLEIPVCDSDKKSISEAHETIKTVIDVIMSRLNYQALCHAYRTLKDFGNRYYPSGQTKPEHDQQSTSIQPW